MNYYFVGMPFEAVVYGTSFYLSDEPYAGADEQRRKSVTTSLGGSP
jgi:hypothetical protein